MLIKAGPGEEFAPLGDGASAAVRVTHSRIDADLNPKAWADRKRATAKAWREKNREHIKQYMARWWEKNPQKERAYRYANKHRATTKQLIDLLASQAALCALCGGSLISDRHLDHKTPKSRGGLSSIGNYQWLCATCNSSKAAQTNEEFIAHIKRILAFVEKT